MEVLWLTLPFLFAIYPPSCHTNGICYEGNFFVWPNIQRGGRSIQEISHNVTWIACRRICRLYSECVGFNMNWSESGEKIGTCTILGEKTNWINPNVTNKEWSFYGKQQMFVLLK